MTTPRTNAGPSLGALLARKRRRAAATRLAGALAGGLGAGVRGARGLLDDAGASERSLEGPARTLEVPERSLDAPERSLEAGGSSVGALTAAAHRGEPSVRVQGGRWDEPKGGHDASCGPLDALSGRHDASCGPLGAPCGPLGAPCGPLGASCGPLGAL